MAKERIIADQMEILDAETGTARYLVDEHNEVTDLRKKRQKKTKENDEEEES